MSRNVKSAPLHGSCRIANISHTTRLKQRLVPAPYADSLDPFCPEHAGCHACRVAVVTEYEDLRVFESGQDGILVDQRLEFEPLRFEDFGVRKGGWHVARFEGLEGEVCRVREMPCCKVLWLSEVQYLPLCGGGFDVGGEGVKCVEDVGGMLFPAFVVAVEIDVC